MVKNLSASKPPYRVLTISDVHLGNARTPTEWIIANFWKYALPDTKASRELDVIFLNGDITDRALDLGSEDSLRIIAFYTELLNYCAKWKIKIRSLRGTPLHDWGMQAELIVTINESLDVKADVKYINTVSVEYMEDMERWILYVPDEAFPTAARTWEEVQKVMREAGIKKVDWANMHGCFAYQLPMVSPDEPFIHDVDKYLSIVKEWISIGHIHRFSNHDIIVAQGSWDRIAHNEEASKGCMRIINGVFEFIENKGAMRYLTIPVANKPADEIIEIVRKKLNGSEDMCRIRLSCNQGDVGASINNRLRDIFPFANFDKPEILGKEKKTSKKITQELVRLPVLNRHNLEEEIMAEIMRNDPQRVNVCQPLVRGIIENTR